MKNRRTNSSGNQQNNGGKKRIRRIRRKKAKANNVNHYACRKKISQSCSLFLSLIYPLNYICREKKMEVFKSVCKLKLNISEEIFKKWQLKVVEQYANRHYHNLNMIEKKMEVIRDFTDDETLSCALIFASIFQYYHFDGKEDKVRDNCDEFKLFVEQSGIKDAGVINRVLRMLQDDTLTDEIEDFQEDVDIFKDLDIVILGSSNDDYTQYVKNVEKEYSTDDDDSYKKDRLKMLKTLLMIPNIFSNQKLRDKYEETARVNIEKEIEELEKNNELN